MGKINLIVLCAVIAILAAAIIEMKRVGVKIDSLYEKMYDIDLEVSKFSAAISYMGDIGDRAGAVSVNGEIIGAPCKK